MRVAAVIGALALACLATAPALAKSAAPAWSMNATIIEACSCPMFCQCYFATKPAAHASAAGHSHDGTEAAHSHDATAMGGDEHFCRANNVFRVNKGSYGATKLDGAKFWLAMDLGDDFSDGTMKWYVAHFDPSVTPQQREGIAAILGYVYPVKWEQPGQVGADMPIEWVHQGDKAWAKLDGGKAGEVVLNGAAVNHNKAAEPVVIKNLHYWGVPRHDGFVLMPNEVEAYRLGPNAFEFKGTNGFMITFDINSKDVAAAAGSTSGY
jgi:hypothetical protein